MVLTSDDLQAIVKLLEPIKADILEIQLTLENESNRNIKIIAEGHAILNRRLDEALRSIKKAFNIDMSGYNDQ